MIGRFRDVAGRREVGLADAEVDDVLALRGKGAGAGEDGEGVLFADAVEAGNGMEHVDLGSVCVAGAGGALLLRTASACFGQDDGHQ